MIYALEDFPIPKGSGKIQLFEHFEYLRECPFLEMKSLGLIREKFGDIMRPKKSVGRFQDIKASLAEDALGESEMKLRILGMKMFNELITKNHIR